MLRRRRRARERAAAAASGQSVAPVHRRRDVDEEEEEDLLNQEARFEDPKAVDERVSMLGRSVLRDRDKDGVGVAGGGA